MAIFQQLEYAVVIKDRARVIHVFRDVAYSAATQLSVTFGQQRVGAFDGLTAVTVLPPLLHNIPDHYHLTSGKNSNLQ
jgi:hypothetical protein